MKRIILTLTIVVAALFASVGFADAAGTWGNAQAVTGFSAIGGNGASQGKLILCTAPGNCTAYGSYSSTYDAFVATEVNGVWGAAATIPSLVTLTAGTGLEFEAAGCSPQNTCVIAGSYGGLGGLGTSSFVYDPSTGSAIEIPGLPVLNIGGSSEVTAASCSSTGNCSVVGTYRDVSSVTNAFVANQVGGVWQPAAPVTGMSSGGELYAVSCWADGECMAFGSTDNGMQSDAVTVARTGGVWQAATAVAGLSSLTTDITRGDEISCAVGPVCHAVGTSYGTTSKVFVTTFANGTWSNAAWLAPFPELDVSTFTDVNGLSCWTATSCFVAGSYSSVSSEGTWMAELVNGVWTNAAPAPGMDALATNGGSPTATACATDGTCAVVGYYNDGTNYQGFVFNRFADGTYSNAQPIPGLAALNVGGYGDPKGATCFIGGCAATGWFRPDPNGTAAFVVDMVATPSPAPTPDPIAPAFTG